MSRSPKGQGSKGHLQEICLCKIKSWNENCCNFTRN